MKTAAKNNPNFLVDQIFITISNSEYCDENFSTIAYDYSYEEFTEIEYRVRYMEDLREAAERDYKREEARRNIPTQP